MKAERERRKWCIERGREGDSERRRLEFDSIFSQRERETVRGGDWSLMAFSHKERGRR